MTAGETYPMPEGGWVCFHCGKRFLRPGPARLHFGDEPSSTAACLMLEKHRSLLYDVRRLERAMGLLLSHANRRFRREA